MKYIKKILLLAIAVLCLASLTGCRQRLMESGEVDRVISQEPEVPDEQKDENTPPEDEPDLPSNDNNESDEMDRDNPQSQSDANTDNQTGTGEISDLPGGENNSPIPNEEGRVEGIPVTLDANGGSCPVKKIAVTSTEPYGELPAATRSGYAFVGWYTAKDGGICITAETIVSNTEPHTLYAAWVIRTELAVFFDGNGGRVKSRDASRTISTGDEYGELPIPLREGYDFTGWFTDAAAGREIFSTSKFLGTKDQTLYAHWQYNPNKYWSYILANDIQQMYSCQAKSVYVEFGDHETKTYCSLLDKTESYNIAANRGDDTTVTDEWVNEKNPNVVVKFVNSMGNAASSYSEMASRFPGRQVLVIPTDAIYGSDSQQLFYTLSFGKLLYSDWFENFDVDKAASELGISVRIYG